MSKKKRKLGSEEPIEDRPPSWVVDEHLDRTTPYTEEELDLLVEGTLESIRDTAVWKNLVHEVGMQEALDRLRSRLIMLDRNAMKLPTN
ncbi:hypothetical protein ACFL2Q_16495 [Thermodesulfobacteriota bacterium]